MTACKGWTGFVSDDWQTNTNPSALPVFYNDYQATTPENNLFGPWLVNGANNYFYSLASFNSATGEETGSFIGAPQLQAPGTEPTCFGAAKPCPAGYQVNVGAPVVGAGFVLSQPPYNLPPPLTDYYGNPFTLWNMGADGSAPASGTLVNVDNASVSSLTFYYLNAPANSQIVLFNVTIGQLVPKFPPVPSSGSHAAITVPMWAIHAGTYVLQMQNIADGSFVAQSSPFTIE